MLADWRCTNQLWSSFLWGNTPLQHTLVDMKAHFSVKCGYGANSLLVNTWVDARNALYCVSLFSDVGINAVCICSHTSRCLNINSTTYPNGLFTELSLARLINKGLLCPCCRALAKMWAFVCARWEFEQSVLVCKRERACVRFYVGAEPTLICSKS